MILISFLTALLFLGGWLSPFQGWCGTDGIAGMLAAPASQWRCPGAARRLEHLADERGRLAACRHALIPRSAGTDLEVIVHHDRAKVGDVA